jgi:hypothetical protein
VPCDECDDDVPDESGVCAISSSSCRADVPSAAECDVDDVTMCCDMPCADVPCDECDDDMALCSDVACEYNAIARVDVGDCNPDGQTRCWADLSCRWLDDNVRDVMRAHVASVRRRASC